MLSFFINKLPPCLSKHLLGKLLSQALDLKLSEILSLFLKDLCHSRNLLFLLFRTLHGSSLERAELFSSSKTGGLASAARLYHSSDHCVRHLYNFPLAWSHVCYSRVSRSRSLIHVKGHHVWKHPLVAHGVYIFSPSGEFSLVPSSTPLFLSFLKKHCLFLAVLGLHCWACFSLAVMGGDGWLAAVHGFSL